MSEKRYVVGIILLGEDCVILPIEDGEYGSQLDALRRAKSTSDLPFTWGTVYAVFDRERNSVATVCINGQVWVGSSEDYRLVEEETEEEE